VNGSVLAVVPLTWSQLMLSISEESWNWIK